MDRENLPTGNRLRQGFRHLMGRRAFLQGSGLAIGGLGALHAIPGVARSDADDPHQNPLEYCNPWPPPSSLPFVFSPDMSLPIRMRKSAFELTDPEKARLRKAYKRLRDLTTADANDPRGWLRQANVSLPSLRCINRQRRVQWQEKR
jgi:hypothetical protein